MLETESSKHCHVTSSRITHVGLRNHHSILSVTFPECLMLEDGIITTFYREFLPEWMAHFEYEIVATLSHEFLFGHGSLWTMKCSQSIYVNLSWILDYGIVTTYSRNFLMNSVCWTMILQQHYRAVYHELFKCCKCYLREIPLKMWYENGDLEILLKYFQYVIYWNKITIELEYFFKF